jgi:hypothetical protein
MMGEKAIETSVDAAASALLLILDELLLDELTGTDVSRDRVERADAALLETACADLEFDLVLRLDATGIVVRCGEGP